MNRKTIIGVIKMTEHKYDNKNFEEYEKHILDKVKKNY